MEPSEGRLEIEGEVRVAELLDALDRAEPPAPKAGPPAPKAVRRRPERGDPIARTERPAETRTPPV